MFTPIRKKLLFSAGALALGIAGGLSYSAQAQVTEHKHADCGVDVRAEDMPNGDYGGFFTWSEMVKQMDGWLEKYPNILQCQSLGTSVEGRKIPLLKISDNPGKDEDEPELLYLVGVHPREQAPTVAIMRFVDELLSQYGKDPEITKLIDTRELWVVPMLNVDGKIHDFKHGNSTTRGADWRKNRRKNDDGTVGVDLNRNFPIRWGGGRAIDPAWRTSTADTSGNIYEGPAPGSEPETKAIMDFIQRRPLRIMLDLHSPLHDLRAPRYLSATEQPVYEKLLKGLQASQKQPYTIQLGSTDKEPAEERNGNTGVSFIWSYYATGAYSFNIEMAYNVAPAGEKPKYSTGIRARYAPADTVESEYQDNIRGPLLTLLRMAGDLKLDTKGNAKLASSSWEGTPTAGSSVTWKPKMAGNFDYAVAMSEHEAGVVKTEFRYAPATNGYVIEIQKDTAPGTRIPLSLYVWNRDRQLSILKTELVTK